MELIFIGENFYSDSGTIMSSIYTVDGLRSDWGQVKIALGKGESVHIRPATDSELLPYKNKLVEYVKNREYVHSNKYGVEIHDTYR